MPAPEQDGDRRDVGGDQLQQQPRDLPRHPGLLALDRQLGPEGVDDGHDRQAPPLRQDEPTSRGAQTGRGRCWPVDRSTVATKTTGRPPACPDRPAPRCPFAGGSPRQLDPVADVVVDEAPGVHRSGPARPARTTTAERVPAERRRRPDPHRLRRAWAGRCGSAELVGRARRLPRRAPGDRRPEAQQRRPAQPKVRPVQDLVDDPVRHEVLGDLDACGNSAPVIAANGAGPEEPDEGPRLGRGQVAGGAQRGQDPARGRVAQVHEVRQARAAVLGEAAAMADHLHEGGRALLHPRPAGAGRASSGSPSRWPAGSCDHPGRGGHAHGSAQEPELPGQHRCRTPSSLTASRQHRLVGAGVGAGPVEPAR